MNRRMNPAILFCLFLIGSLLISTLSPAAEKIDVVESETGFYYTIKKGDTLWDLSQQFSDSPWLWPELWEDNDQITNPHWIFPGERIRLYKKSGSQTVIETTSDAPVTVEPVKPVPPKAAGPYFVFSGIDMVGFIRKPPVAPLGTIFEVEGYKVMISEGDIVYIRPSPGTPEGMLVPGSRHLVFRYMSPTETVDAIKAIGTQHYIAGIVEVTKRESDMVIAKVLKSFRTIKVDDMLMPYQSKHSKVQLKPSTPGIDGQIISGEDHTDLNGQFMLAFIDKGTADNIEVGQQYNLYRQKKTDLHKEKGTTKRLPPVDFGTILVLHTEQTTSTVVITKSNSAVFPGDRFRTPIE